MLNFSAPLLPALMPNKLTWELLWFLLSLHSADSGKMDSLSLYSIFEHFNVHIKEWKSHPKIPKDYMEADVIFIKGSILPHNIGKNGPPNL